MGNSSQQTTARRAARSRTAASLTRRLSATSAGFPRVGSRAAATTAGRERKRNMRCSFGVEFPATASSAAGQNVEANTDEPNKISQGGARRGLGRRDAAALRSGRKVLQLDGCARRTEEAAAAAAEEGGRQPRRLRRQRHLRDLSRGQGQRVQADGARQARQRQ